MRLCKSAEPFEVSDLHLLLLIVRNVVLPKLVDVASDWDLQISQSPELAPGSRSVKLGMVVTYCLVRGSWHV